MCFHLSLPGRIAKTRIASVLCLAFALLHSGLQAQDAFHYAVDFEIEENFTPGGDLFPWSVSSGVVTTIDTDSAFGLQSLLLTPHEQRSELSISFEPALDSLRFIDVHVRPVVAASLNDLPTEAQPGNTALVSFIEGEDGAGELVVCDGPGPDGLLWIPTGNTFSLTERRADAWIRITCRIDYATGLWDLYVDEALLLADLQFADPSAVMLTTFSLIGDEEAETGVDTFTASSQHPLFADQDRDGIPDDYEQANQLNASLNDRYVDSDLDGLDNLYEYQNGLLAGNPDTDADGVPDGWELEDGTDPLTAESLLGNTLPFLEDFESITTYLDLLDRLWFFTQEAYITLLTSNPYEGFKALSLWGGEEESLVLQNPFISQDTPEVWIDMRIQPGFFQTDTPPEINTRTSAAFFFDPEGTLWTHDGIWRKQEGAVLQGPASLDAAPRWQRVTLRLNYPAQTWSIWLNNRIVAHQLRFANLVPFFNRLSFTKDPGDVPAAIDAIRIGTQTPPRPASTTMATE